MEIVSASSQHLDLNTAASRVRELENTLSNLEEESSNAERILKDCAINFQSRVEEVVSDWSDVGFHDEKDYDACLERLKEELNLVEAENTKMSQEIEVLSVANSEDVRQLEIELESLKYSLDYTALQDLEKVNTGVPDYRSQREDPSNAIGFCDGDRLEILALENQIQNKKLIFKSLEELDSILKWFDVTEQIEDEFASVKVIAFDQNCIRLSLVTYISIPESVSSQQKIQAVDNPFEVKHELLIEVVEGTMDHENVEIFPNDVHIDNILDAAKELRKSSLQWLVTKVQDRILLCTMRQLVVNSAHKSGYSLEYRDKDEMMVAHHVRGFDAFIKVPQDWPLSNSPLKLMSLKSSDHNSNGVSSSFLCRVKEGANSEDVHIREVLPSFLDAIEKLLQMAA